MFDIYGLNAICRNTQGKTPLHIAVDHDKMPDGHLRIVDSLLEQSSVKLNVLNVQDAEVCYMYVPSAVIELVDSLCRVGISLSS